MSPYHLAQFNYSKMRGPSDSEVMAEFMRVLDPINLLADVSPGFVWRLQNHNGNATEERPFEDADKIINLSVWEDLDSLKHYVFKSGHLAYLKRRKEWFLPLDEGPTSVLWWVPAGHRPTVAESLEKLAYLRQNGPSSEAFTFTTPFPAPQA